jgi:hypothetical protein
MYDIKDFNHAAAREFQKKAWMEAAIKEGWGQWSSQDINRINDEWTKKINNIGLDYQELSAVMH